MSRLSRRRWLFLQLILALLACAFAVRLTQEAMRSWPLPPPPAIREASISAATPGTPTSDSRPFTDLHTYGVIVAKNLFSPSRSETTVADSIRLGPRPILHGVVIDGETSRAYLEDPATKRILGYAVGDAIVGGRLEQISEGGVVIQRPGVIMEVLLQDPSKPRPVDSVVPAGQQRPLGMPGSSPALTQIGEAPHPGKTPPQLRRRPGPGQPSQ